MKLNLSEVDVNGSFETMPPGIYEIKLTNYAIKSAISGNTYMKCEYEVINGKYVGRKIWDNIVFTPEAYWKLKSLALACGYPKANSSDADTDEIFECALNVLIQAKVIVEKYTNKAGEKKESNKIETYLFDNHITNTSPNNLGIPF